MTSRPTVLKGKIPVLPIANRVVLPGSTLRVTINNFQECKDYLVSKGKRLKYFGIVTYKNAKKKELYNYGCLVGVVQEQAMVRGENLLTSYMQSSIFGKTYWNLVVIALHRFKVQSLSESDGNITANINLEFDRSDTLDPKLETALKEISGKVLNKGEEKNNALLGFMVAGTIDLTVPEKQGLLENFDLNSRTSKIIEFFHQSLEQKNFDDEFDSKLKDMIDNTTSKGAGNSTSKPKNPMDQLHSQIQNLKVSAEIKDHLLNELSRLRSVPSVSPEHNLIRTYLNTACSLPWDKSSTDNYDIDKAQIQLDADHFGLDKVKKRIIEYLAVRGLRKDMKGSILCFNGPPGVGKTSLGKSIAQAMGRKFHRISLGGVRDEAEIRGHRRTYVGALPGVFISALKRCETNNPVILLDEIDKVGKDMIRGDPASALLEVLDPAQNNSFTDHYLALPFDLSNVLFIATSNRAETIPPALYDRMEVIDISGYTTIEKVNIAQKFLVPKQVEANGLNINLIEITEKTLEDIALMYTREAGVRQLERNIGGVCRNVAVEYSKNKEKFGKAVITPEKLEDILGVPLYENDLAERLTVPGVALGLAWTPVGGKVLLVESAKSQGSGRLKITGHLGDVMKESILTAISWIKSCLPSIVPEVTGVSSNVEGIDGIDLHVHFPAAAVPKDGPSAGIAITTALVSLLTGFRVRSDTAMTGEVSLKGKVLPIGGVKEKILGAHRMGVYRILLPVKNRKDMRDIPDYVKSQITVLYVSTVEEVLREALEDSSFLPLSKPKL